MVSILGRVLAAEILLGLALQRGSLQHLLEWVEMALITSATTELDQEGNLVPQTIYIRSNKLNAAILTIRQSENSSEVSDEVKNVQLYDCAFILMDEVN